MRFGSISPAVIALLPQIIAKLKTLLSSFQWPCLCVGIIFVSVKWGAMPLKNCPYVFLTQNIYTYYWPNLFVFFFFPLPKSALQYACSWWRLIKIILRCEWNSTWRPILFINKKEIKNLPIRLIDKPTMSFLYNGQYYFTLAYSVPHSCFFFSFLSFSLFFFLEQFFRIWIYYCSCILNFI